jgi:hypothetical protein
MSDRDPSNGTAGRDTSNDGHAQPAAATANGAVGGRCGAATSAHPTVAEPDRSVPLRPAACRGSGWRGEAVWIWDGCGLCGLRQYGGA